MAKVINVNSKKKMIEIASQLMQKADPSIKNMTHYLLPKAVKNKEHKRKIRELEAFKDSYNNLEYDYDRHAAKTLTDLSEKCLKDLTTANGAYIAEIMAYNMIDMEIDGVTFNVPQNVKDELFNSAKKRSEVASDLNRELGVYTSALNSVINGEPYNYNVETSYSGRVTYADNYNSTPDWEEYREESNKYLKKAAAAMGKGYESYADGRKYEEFSGRRAYNEATLRVNMHDSDGLTKENYAERLKGANVSANDVNWAKNTIKNMLISIYGQNEYDNMQDVKFLDCVYVDGMPASYKYTAGGYGQKCCEFMRDVLNGRHQFAVRAMSTENGEPVYGELKPLNVIPSLVAEEEFSIWRAILRFFGIELKSNTKKFEEAVQFNQLLDSDILDSIKKFDHITAEYSEAVAPIKEEYDKCNGLFDNIEEYCFLSNFDNPESYLKAHTTYYNDEFITTPSGVEQQLSQDTISTMTRKRSRGSLAAIYMLSKGMTIDRLIYPSEEDKKLMKQYGQEFVDKLTIPTQKEIIYAMNPTYSSSDVQNAIKTDKLARERYEREVEEKLSILSETYVQLTATLEKLEQELPQVDYNDNRSIANAVVSHSLFLSGSVDLMQSLEGGMLYKRKDPVACKAVDYGFDAQFKSPMLELSKEYSSPALSSVFVSPSTANSLANLLAMKSYGYNITTGGVKPGVFAFTDAQHLTENLNCELRSFEGKKEATEVMAYVKRIVCGELPFPKNLIDTKNKTTHLIKCFEEYKNNPEPQRQAQRTNTM